MPSPERQAGHRAGQRRENSREIGVFFCSRGVEGKDAAEGGEGEDRSTAEQKDVTIQEPGSGGEEEIKSRSVEGIKCQIRGCSRILGAWLLQSSPSPLAWM